MMKRTAVSCFVITALLAASLAAAEATVIDRIAALIDREVVTLSEVSQLIELRLLPQRTGEDEAAHRRRVLDALIAQTLRFRDVERFGAPEDVSKDAIESRLAEIRKRFSPPDTLEAALQRSEVTLDELRALLKRQIQVEAYIQERFSPMIFVSLDEIEKYYRGTWSVQRKERGLAAQPLGEVREEIRSLLKSTRLQEEIDKWTLQLRTRANVDVYVYR